MREVDLSPTAAEIVREFAARRWELALSPRSVLLEMARRLQEDGDAQWRTVESDLVARQA